jgi:hypothetical protein
MLIFATLSALNLVFQSCSAAKEEEADPELVKVESNGKIDAGQSKPVDNRSDLTEDEKKIFALLEDGAFLLGVVLDKDSPVSGMVTLKDASVVSSKTTLSLGQSLIIPPFNMVNVDLKICGVPVPDVGDRVQVPIPVSTNTDVAYIPPATGGSGGVLTISNDIGLVPTGNNVVAYCPRGSQNCDSVTGYFNEQTNSYTQNVNPVFCTDMMKCVPREETCGKLGLAACPPNNDEATRYKTPDIIPLPKNPSGGNPVSTNDNTSCSGEPAFSCFVGPIACDNGVWSCTSPFNCTEPKPVEKCTEPGEDWVCTDNRWSCEDVYHLSRLLEQETMKVRARQDFLINCEAASMQTCAQQNANLDSGCQLRDTMVRSIIPECPPVNCPVTTCSLPLLPDTSNNGVTNTNSSSNQDENPAYYELPLPNQEQCGTAPQVCPVPSMPLGGTNCRLVSPSGTCPTCPILVCDPVEECPKAPTVCPMPGMIPGGPNCPLVTKTVPATANCPAYNLCPVMECPSSSQ